MGAIAEAMVAYAQPLIDQTDGSIEQMNKALLLAQLCWNLAVSPKDEQERLLSAVRPSLHLDENGFDDMRRTVIEPMIQRHREMFPLLPRRDSMDALPSEPPPELHMTRASERFTGAPPYEPCPCGSGRKYKFCCRSKGR